MSKIHKQANSVSGLSGALFGGGGGGGGRNRRKITPIRDTPSQSAERAEKEKQARLAAAAKAKQEKQEKADATAARKADEEQQKRGYPAGHPIAVPDKVVNDSSTWGAEVGKIKNVPGGKIDYNSSQSQTTDICTGCHVRTPITSKL